jgi:putative membrane protein
VLSFIFHIHKADTFRKLWPLMLSVSIFSAGVAYLELNHLKLAETAYIKNVGMMHSLLGFVISMLLVFRTNTSYDRWWDGRKLLGALTNVSRNLAIKLKALNLPAAELEFFKYAIPKYAFALKEHLREKQYFGKDSFLIEIDGGKHIPNQVASSIVARLYSLQAANQISHEQLITLMQMLASLPIFVEDASASEIHQFLIPIARLSRNLSLSMSSPCLSVGYSVWVIL